MIRRHLLALTKDTTTTTSGPRDGRRVSKSFLLGTPGFAITGSAPDIAISGLTPADWHHAEVSPELGQRFYRHVHELLAQSREVVNLDEDDAAGAARAADKGGIRSGG